MSDSTVPNKMEEINRRLRVTEGELQHLLDMFGNDLAKRNNYQSHQGIEAVWWFLIEKYKWKPSDVRALNYEDLSFLMQEEKATFSNSE